VISELYWNMLCNSSVPQPVVTGLPVNTIVNAGWGHTVHSERYLGFSP
jgi:hypothetical protein